MVPVESMTVAHSEDMEAKVPNQVWHKYVRILILFLGVSWNMTHAGRKCELGYTIKPLTGFFGDKSVIRNRASIG